MYSVSPFLSIFLKIAHTGFQTHYVAKDNFQFFVLFYFLIQMF